MTHARRRSGARASGATLAASTLVGLVLLGLLGALSMAGRPAPAVGAGRWTAALSRAPGAPANEWGLRVDDGAPPARLTRVERPGDPAPARPTAPLLGLGPAALGLALPGAIERLRSRLRGRAPRPAAPRVPSARAPPR